MNLSERTVVHECTVVRRNGAKGSGVYIVQTEDGHQFELRQSAEYITSESGQLALVAPVPPTTNEKIFVIPTTNKPTCRKVATWGSFEKLRHLTGEQEVGALVILKGASVEEEPVGPVQQVFDESVKTGSSRLKDPRFQVVRRIQNPRRAAKHLLTGASKMAS